MSMNNQQQQSMSNGSFALIWYYWFKKYMQRKTKKTTSLQELANLKQKYRIESIETQGQQNALNLKQRIQQIKQKTRSSSPLNLQSSLSATTNNTNSLTNPPLFYTINPELEAKQIEEVLLGESDQKSENQNNQQAKQMVNELHSYYLNSKSIFVIYKLEKDSPLQQTVSKLLNSSYGEGSLRTSKLNLSSILNEDDSLGGVQRNDSILESFDKMQDRIDNLELVDKFADVDGLQIWNVKYFSIPHCLVKIKKNCWAKSLGEINVSNTGGVNFSNIIHPSQPKTISSLPIIPRISKHKPSIDKLQPFVSYMQMLWSKCPNLSPTCESIFQYNGLPYIFTQDYREENIAVLCYYIVYGNQEGNLTQRFVDRWIQNNPNASLSKTIKYMRQIVKDKNSQSYSNQVAIKGLFDQGDVIW